MEIFSTHFYTVKPIAVNNSCVCFCSYGGNVDVVFSILGFGLDLRKRNCFLLLFLAFI